MKYKLNSKSPFYFAIGLVSSIIVSPKDNYFMANFIGFGFSQLIPLVLLFLFKAKKPVLYTVATILALYLFFFVLYMEKNSGEAMSWLLYFLSIPGITIGALITSFIINYDNIERLEIIVITTILSCLLGGFLFIEIIF